MTRTARTVVLLLATVLAAACGGGQRTPMEVTVGVILPLQSGVGAAAASALRGAELAAEEVGAEGAVRLNLRTADDGGSFERAAQIFTRIAGETDAVAVIGAFTDSVAVSLSPLASRTKLLLISPGATGEVPYAGDFFFRTALPATLQGRALAEYALGAGLRRVSVMYDSNEYGTAVALAFVEEFVAGGGEVVAQRLFRDGTRDFERFVRAVRSERPQALVFAGYPDEGAAFFEQAAEAELVNLRVLAPDSFANEEAVREMAGRAHGMIVAAAFFRDNPVPAVRAFVRAYRGKFGHDPDPFAAQAYDAVRVVALALRKVGAADRTRLREAVATIRDYPGVTGTLTFDRFGNPAREVLLLRVDGSRLVVLP
ncbi:MAG: ABC transporter substrate-binding protein [Armatimonadota bacterium]|nr:ABC transporter substrate-binding protein [Armatimonadota bacterium]MDR5696583.1 ABC transporter substrate-binding protein [Armatimonadota bacterium]